MKPSDVCYKCGESKPIVYDSRFNDGYRRRSKRCRACGNTWNTIEVVEPEASMYIRIPMKDAENTILRITKALFGEDIEIIKT